MHSNTKGVKCPLYLSHSKKVIFIESFNEESQGSICQMQCLSMHASTPKGRDATGVEGNGSKFNYQAR